MLSIQYDGHLDMRFWSFIGTAKPRTLTPPSSKGTHMLNQQTLHKLYVMRLNGMADAFRQQLEQPDLGALSFEERFGLLVERQWSWKEDRALARRLRNSRLKTTASVEDIDYQTPRGLDRSLLRSLSAESEWVKQH